MMIKIEYVDEDEGQTCLLEIKIDGSQYEMYVDGKLRGSTNDYEILRNEMAELAAAFVRNMTDKVVAAKR